MVFLPWREKKNLPVHGPDEQMQCIIMSSNHQYLPPPNPSGRSVPGWDLAVAAQYRKLNLDDALLGDSESV